MDLECPMEMKKRENGNGNGNFTIPKWIQNDDSQPQTNKKSDQADANGPSPTQRKQKIQIHGHFTSLGA